MPETRAVVLPGIALNLQEPRLVKICMWRVFFLFFLNHSIAKGLRRIVFEMFLVIYSDSPIVHYNYYYLNYSDEKKML